MAEVTMYTTEWCGYCKRLKSAMKQHGISFDEIDIEEHDEFGPMIEELTGGFRTVPTLEICGDYLVNPSLHDVVAAAEGCGAGAA